MKTDLNTLFCFHEELTQKELSEFCNLLKRTAEENGIAAAFDHAEKMMLSYPRNEILLLNATLSLDGVLQMSTAPEAELIEFFEKVEKWYQHLAESIEPATRNAANFMLVNRYIDRGNLEQAQAVLETMPDRNRVVDDYADKLLLQIKIYMKQGRAADAAKELEKTLLTEVNKVQMLLIKLADAEMAAGELEKANHIVLVHQDMVKLFDLWACSAFSSAISLALECKDKEKILPLLQGILQTALEPWDMGASCLYHRIAGTNKKTVDKSITSALLNGVAQFAQYDFLRDDPRFQTILEECNKIIDEVSHSNATVLSKDIMDTK